MVRELFEEVEMPDVEFCVDGQDQPSRSISQWFPHEANITRAACKLVASIGSHPTSCALTLPTGLRVRYPVMRRGDSGRGAFEFDGTTRWGLNQSTPYAMKPRNATFYVGGLWPATRCGNKLKDSARYFLVKQSVLHPEVLNASFGPPTDKTGMRVLDENRQILQHVSLKGAPVAEHECACRDSTLGHSPHALTRAPQQATHARVSPCLLRQ